jgi:hypothetical protein
VTTCHRTVDVIVRHRLRRASKAEMTMPVDQVSELVSAITREVYAEAAGSLSRFLFSDKFDENSGSELDLSTEGEGQFDSDASDISDLEPLAGEPVA